MLRHCLLLAVVAILAASGSAAWAASVFTDISATDGYAQAHPTGVAAGGLTVLQGILPGQPTLFYHTFLYPGGTAGTMSDITSTFTGVVRIGSTNMNASGQFVACQTSPAFGNNSTGGWFYANGTATALATYPSTYETYSAAINNNGDTAGYYRLSGGGDPLSPFVRTGGTCYQLNNNAQYGSCVSALNTSGQAAGWGQTDNPPRPHAEVWNYSISSGTVTSQTVDIQTFGLTGSSLSGAAAAYPSCLSSAALAVNNSGQVLVAANNSSQMSAPLRYNGDTATFLYDMSSKTFTSLGSLQLFDDQVQDGTGTQFGGHAQALNDGGQVVGRIAVTGGYDAAIWENGTVTDLNARYASILPTGFTLNNATAIDNSGDIAGFGTDGLGNTVQAFMIMNKPPMPGDANLDGTVNITDLSRVLTNYDKTGKTWADGDFNGDSTVNISDLSVVLTNYDKTGSPAAGMAAVPEPSTLMLLAAGLIGLLAYAWRKGA